jgi:hypothetical protein
VNNYKPEQEPHSPIRQYTLVPPYFTGDGKEYDSILMFHEGPKFIHGSMFTTDKDDILRVMADSIFEEDFFENITITLCQLVTNNAQDKVDDRARELYYVASYSSENNS